MVIYLFIYLFNTRHQRINNVSVLVAHFQIIPALSLSLSLSLTHTCTHTHTHTHTHAHTHTYTHARMHTHAKDASTSMYNDKYSLAEPIFTEGTAIPATTALF